MIKLVFLLLCASALVMIMGNVCKSFVVPLIVCAGCIVFFTCISFLENIVNQLREMANSVGVQTVYIGELLRVCGIAYFCEFASNVCRDSGQATFAMKIEMIGKFLILGQTIPLFSNLIEIIRSIFQMRTMLF